MHTRLTARSVRSAFALVVTICLVSAFSRARQSPAAPPQTGGRGTAIVVGRILDAASGQPLTGAIVTIAGPSANVTPVMVDRQGRFVFRDLATGSYSIFAEKSGFVRGAYGKARADGANTPLLLGDGEHVLNADIRMWRYASIAGTVLDEAGESMVGVSVAAYRRTIVGGHWSVLNVGGDTTDDRGAFRIAELAPGDYVVVCSSPTITYPMSVVEAEASARAGGPATEQAWQQELDARGAARLGVPPTLRPSARAGDFVFMRLMGPDVPVPRPGEPLRLYHTTYATSASDLEHASHVVLNAGDDRTGVDVHLHLSPAVRLSGTVTGPGGPAGHIGLRLRRADMKDLSAPVLDQVGATMSDEAGRFTFLGVPPGRFTIWAMTLPGATGLESLWASPNVSVGEADVTGVSVVLQPAPRVSGHIVFEGSTPPPAARVRTLRLTLDSADGQRAVGPVVAGGGGPPRLQVDADGALSGVGLLPGSYFVRVDGIPAGWFLKSVAAGTIDVSADAPLVLDRSIDNLVVTITDRDTALAGTVRNTTGTGDATATVILFPADRRAWIDYGASPRRLRTARAGRSGEYTIGSLPPGDYFAVAIADAAAGSWQEPSMLDRLAAIATRVRVASGATTPLELRTSVIR